MADQVATVAPAPAPEQLDVAQIKTMLNLPATATDIELITALVQLIAQLQQKYDALLADAVELEDKVANRDLQDFDDLITPETSDFWKAQLLRNRDESINILLGLRQARGAQPAAAPAPEPEPEPQPKPLFRNRLINPVRTMSEIAEETPAASTTRAVKIRNRAQEIRATEKIPYALAFARAEKEME
ncbi:MAG TPA: hypothetical protein PLE77_11560 [Kiritimatiellia bacterium]|nr:hypothetical protein [Kiritimatiellia bacterium]